MSRHRFSAQQLRDMRLKAGYTQKELASKISVSRETIVAIENDDPKAVNALKVDLLTRWWHACKTLIPNESRTSFTSYLMEFFGVD